MQQLVYAIQFKSSATPHEGTPNVMNVKGEAASASITTVVHDQGLTGGFDPAAVVPVSFESEVKMLESNTFTESGTITFGDKGNRLLFKSVGTGWMAPGPQDGVSQGAISWVIEGGEGQFAGAKGVITSNFTIGSDGEVSDYQLGVLYLA